MKILIYGFDKTLRRIKSSLEFSGAKTTMVSGGLENILAMNDGEGISMAILDVTAVDAQKSYEHIKKTWDIPVVLVLSQDESDWSEIAKLDADGYLPRDLGDIEIVARIEAINRRVKKSMIGQ
jgi:DNA-binding response OmpR family regulator